MKCFGDDIYKSCKDPFFHILFYIFNEFLYFSLETLLQLDA